ncbi:uncharacterized protein A4U43_C10F9580 [Asparagus officinalis]|uniref:DUF4378 domain-containing protein n=1 Tax=Asparagus officinalis TaxID=4686 RepID=A0A5P1E3H4_ASPOF|nr:uncharacterized protein LOC109825817 isoform X2 [Asparagus officinalis]ONK56513.1 uncharacterized protein A4U43_C10F9580 [Asparagus officinalis]
MVNGDRCVFRRQLSVAAVGSDDGEEGSESFVSSSSSGELDCFPCEKSHKSPSQNQSPLLSSSMEGEHQGVEYKGCVSEEEKEQLSPVSIMDFPCQYEDDEGEDEEARTFGFERNLANIEKTTHELLQKIRRFETLAELVDPLDLDLRFSSSDDEYDLHVASSKDITAKHLIQRLRSNFEVDRQAEKLLVDFFSEAPSSSAGSASTDTERLLSAAGNWINDVGCLKAEEHGKVHLSEMERNARWRRCEDGKDDVAADVESIVFGSLLHELVLELANTV